MLIQIMVRDCVDKDAAIFWVSQESRLRPIDDAHAGRHIFDTSHRLSAHELKRPEERSYFSGPSEADCEPVDRKGCSLPLCRFQGVLGSFAPDEGTGIPDVPDKDCEADVADTLWVLPASVSRSLSLWLRYLWTDASNS